MQGLGGQLLSEDEHWAARGWGEGLRTAEQEGVVRADVIGDLLDAAAAESAVVLEFITYSPPPNAWSTYRAALTAAGILHRTIVLAPTVEQIVDRLRSRGRSRDLAHLDLRRGEAAAPARLLGRDGSVRRSRRRCRPEDGSRDRCRVVHRRAADRHPRVSRTSGTIPGWADHRNQG